MLPSLYAAISGLKANQQKLNVVANNIGNASTTGFKTQSMNFEDMMSQTLSDPSAPAPATAGGTDGIGGINGKQSGLGVKVSGIGTDFSEGSSQTTNRSLDFMANKAGNYFVVNNGTQEYYTRDGAFTLDTDGNLLTQDGNHVMGYINSGSGIDISDPKKVTALTIRQYYADANATTGTNTAPGDAATNLSQKVNSFSIGGTGIVTVKTNGGSYDIGQIALASFQNEGGLVKQGGNLYSNSTNSGDATYGTPGTGDCGTITSGALEMSNVDLAQQFTDMIIASRAFAANGKIITTDDEILQDLVNLKR